MSDKLLLVGSIPLDTVQEVFESFGTPLGRYHGDHSGRRGWPAPALDQPRPLSGARRPPGARDRTPTKTRQRGRAARAARCERQLAVPGQGRGRSGPLRRSGLAAWLRARRDQLVLRVQDLAREGRIADAPALPGVAAVGQQRAAAADFSQHRRPRQDQARLRGRARGRGRQDRRENPAQGSRDPVGLRERGRRRLRQYSAVRAARARSSATRASSRASRDSIPGTSRSAITSASARLAAGRASARRTLARRSILPMH